MVSRWLAYLTAMACLLTVFPVHGQDRANDLRNLRVLPRDISNDELIAVMLEALSGLGLPRRQSEGCLFCHVGDMERAVDTWDFASDDKLTKRTARAMMAMVAAINNEHLAPLESRVAPTLRVTCQTCHAGRTDPRPLPAVLMTVYREAGVDAAIGRYRELRDRYLGADAYDFRVGALIEVANRIAADGAFDAALQLAALNDELHPTAPDARRARLVLRLRRTAAAKDVAAALEDFDRMRTDESAAVISHDILDGLGWTLWRTDQRDAARSIFRRNLEVFPDEYITNESLADALAISGDRPAAILMYERWLERHPDHTMARRRLTNLRNSR